MRADREPFCYRCLDRLDLVLPRRRMQKAEAIAERIAGGDRVMVPAFWRHEMLNALLVGEKRKRLTPELTQTFIDDLDRLPVDIAGRGLIFAVDRDTDGFGAILCAASPDGA